MFWSRKKEVPQEEEASAPASSSSASSSSAPAEQQQQKEEAAVEEVSNGPPLFIKASVGDVTRRFSVAGNASLAQLHDAVDTFFDDNLPEGVFHFDYMDEEGDWCTVETEAEWKEAKRIHFSSSGNSDAPLKVRVVNGDSRSRARASQQHLPVPRPMGPLSGVGGVEGEPDGFRGVRNLMEWMRQMQHRQAQQNQQQDVTLVGRVRSDGTVVMGDGDEEEGEEAEHRTVEAEMLPDGTVRMLRSYEGKPQLQEEENKMEEDTEEEIQRILELSLMEAARREHQQRDQVEEEEEEEEGVSGLPRTSVRPELPQQQVVEEEEEEEWVLVAKDQQQQQEQEQEQEEEEEEADLSSMSSVETPPVTEGGRSLSSSGLLRFQAEGAALPAARLVADIAHQDGDSVPCGQWFTKTWRLGNPPGSNKVWPEQCYLRWVDGQPLEGAMKVEILCPVGLAPRQTADFSVRVRCPKTPGDYESVFRLFSPDGQPFGPRQYLRLRAVSPAEGSSSSSAPSAPPMPVLLESFYNGGEPVQGEKEQEQEQEQVVEEQEDEVVAPVEEQEQEQEQERMPENVVALVNMGFHVDMARFALEATQDDLEQAVEKLLELTANMQNRM